MPKLPDEILIATGNPGKIAELRALMDGVPVTLRSLGEVTGAGGDVEETGSTFEENARLKAREYARRTGMWAIADDSGLAVEALGGRPGVHSARYGGGDLPFDGKMQLLLDELRNAGGTREAQFVCVMAISDADGNILFSGEGICRGSIAASPRGTGGFGYDPIFVPEGLDRTFGEMTAAEKQQISHRRRAAELIIRYLLHFTAV